MHQKHLNLISKFVATLFNDFEGKKTRIKYYKFLMPHDITKNRNKS